MSDRAGKILRTAERLFARGRYHEVTLDDICHKAGVGKGTVYRYFEDKEDLYYQVILKGLDDLIEAVRTVAETTHSPGEGLQEVARRVVGFFKDRKSLFRLMWTEQFRDSPRRGRMRQERHQKYDELIAVMACIIQQGIDGEVYSNHFPPETSARMLMSMLRAGVRNPEGMPDGREWPVSIVTLLEKGIYNHDGQA